MTDTETELPSLFDSRGIFCELTEADAMNLSEEAFALYAKVHDAYDVVLTIDKRIDDTRDTLAATVAELRAAEAAVRNLPRPSHTDLVRQMSRQTQGLE